MDLPDPFVDSDVSYALDDGMPFPGWAPPTITAGEAAQRYDAGDRFAVLAGDPADPAAAIVLDRRNSRIAVTTAEPSRSLVFTGAKGLQLTGAQWELGTQELAAGRDGGLLRLRRRPVGAPVWIEELFARRAARDAEAQEWPEFGDWAQLGRPVREPGADWWDEGVLDLIDADGWLLEELAQLDVAARWRELARRYDAPRGIGVAPDVQSRLAEPGGWRAVGRRWRRAGEAGGAVVITDASFGSGAGGGSDVTVTITREPVEIVLGLPAATARIESRAGGAPRSPAQPRPSASAQVAVTAVLELAAEVHDAAVDALRSGALPSGWSDL